MNIKKLREIIKSFKDCKIALEETKGDIDKSIEFLRKGIAKAQKMSRTASDGFVLAKEENGKISIIEINSETDFVQNKDFIKNYPR